MVWFKVCDTFYDHPKVQEASDPALALWVKAGSWCGRHLSDGRVPWRWAHRHGSEAAAAELLELGLWIKAGDDYRFHDWPDNNPTREQVVTRRASDADRKRRVRAESDAPSAGSPGRSKPLLTRPGFRAESGVESERTRPQPPALKDLCEHGKATRSCLACIKAAS